MTHACHASRAHLIVTDSQCIKKNVWARALGGMRGCVAQLRVVSETCCAPVRRPAAARGREGSGTQRGNNGKSQSERSPSHSTASAKTCVASCRTGVGGQAKNRSIFSPARLLDVARRRRRAPDRRTPAAPGCERVARQLLPPRGWHTWCDALLAMRTLRGAAQSWLQRTVRHALNARVSRTSVVGDYRRRLRAANSANAPPPGGAMRAPRS